MDIILSQIFLDKLSEFRKNAFTNEDESMILLSSKIIRFLNSKLNIVTNIDQVEVKNCYSNNIGTKEFKTIKDSIIHKLIKNGYAYNDLKEISKVDCKSFLFTDNSCSTNIDDGIIEVNFDKQKEEFYLNSIVTQRTFKNEYEELEKYVPICNSMLYIDPYILEGKKEDRKIKNENFIKFLKAFIKPLQNVNFHLTIISKLGQYDRNKKEFVVVNEQNIKDLLFALQKINNLEYELFLAENLFYGSDFQDRYRDRVFFTNYTKGSFGHPNDGKTTYFNQNFMAISTDVDKDYNDYLKELKVWLNFINKIPATKNNTKTKYGNLKEQNRLFKSL
jgi:hypothetical protein